MAAFTITRAVDAPLPYVWAAATDWGGYARWFPMTRMRLDPPPVRPGWGFAGLTGVGRLALRDSMVLTTWAPPPDRPAQPGDEGAFAVRKTGWLLGGWASVRVRALTPTSSDLHWEEEIIVRPAPVGRISAPLSDRFNEALFTQVVDQMVAQALVAYDLDARRAARGA